MPPDGWRTHDAAHMELTYGDRLPVIRLITPGVGEWRRELTPTETAILLRRLAGYLHAYIIPDHDDELEETA